MNEEKKRLVPKPSNLDLPERFIFKVRRDAPFFKNRSWKFYDVNGDLTGTAKVPDNQIICDDCNLLMISAIIDLIIYMDLEGKAYIEKADCKECIEKYYSSLPVINRIKCRTCSNKIEKFKNKISEKEFLISSMCQDCQDYVFEKGKKEEFEDNFSQHDADRREMDEKFTHLDGD